MTQGKFILRCRDWEQELASTSIEAALLEAGDNTGLVFKRERDGSPTSRDSFDEAGNWYHVDYVLPTRFAA